MNYIIVLFKNKKKKKIIKQYYTEKRAKKKFMDLINTNEKIVFEKVIENATESEYELGLLTNQTNIQESITIKDKYGRNKTANLEDPNYVFLDMKPFKVEEKIYDWQKKTKVSFDNILKIYLNNKNLKNIFTLNNKICIQEDDRIYVFSLKDTFESYRFLEVLQNYFIQNKRSDGIFVKDVSNAQRKWLYQILKDKGFDIKRLYRLKTTFSKR
jgi:hypothetical protein